MPLIRWNTLAWPWKFVDETPSRVDTAFAQNQTTPLDTTPDAPRAFGLDAIWLAVRSPSTQAVAQALQLGQTAPANWHSGLQAVHQPLPCTPGLVFVTPPIQGWVLVTGALPYPGGTSDSDLASSLLQVLSHQFSQVQYFGAHSGIAWHGYARYDEGELMRAFACVDNIDHTIWNVGSNLDEQLRTAQFAEVAATVRAQTCRFAPDLQSTERAPSWPVGMRKIGSDPAFSHEFASDAAAWHQDRVFQMAERWSVNPQQLGAMALPPSLGLVGFLDTLRMNSDVTRRDKTRSAGLAAPTG
jgi:hypothetical protein